MDHKKETALVPVRGEGARLHAVFTPVPEPSETRRRSRFLHSVSVLFSALLCLFFTGIVFLLALAASANIDLPRTALRLAEEAFLGLAYFEIRENAPAGDAEFPFPADTADEPAEDGVPETEAASGENEIAPAPITPAEYPIRQTDLSCGTDGHALFNETTYEPDTHALLAADLPFPDFSAWQAEYGGGDPYVLILHTHGTEAYAPEGALTYTTEDSFRSHNTEENVTAVGTVMAETFEAAGIPVLHCTEMFDAQSYQESYSRAAAAIRTYLEKYPSIQIVLDVHRDSVIRADMTRLRPVTEINGEEYAQFMIVTGTDFKGANHPRWRDNLNFALKIQGNLIARTDSFVRSINLRGAAFNEQYRAGSLLLEVGSCGNTLAQAKRAGVLAAIAIADVVTSGGCVVEVGDILG